AGAVVQEAFNSAKVHGTNLGPIVLSLLTGGRLSPSPAATEAQALAPLAASLERLDQQLERLGRRNAVATGASGVAVGLSVITGAVVLTPDVTADGPVLIVGLVTGLALTLLAWRTFLDRIRG